MNFLSHLHTSPNHDLVRVFNFTGDGYRGSTWKEHASAAELIGVELHRVIDSFTDEHPLTRMAAKSIRERAGKTAPIALDLLGDYFLHKHWNTMRELQWFTKEMTMSDFIKEVSTNIHRNRALLKGKAKNMAPFMLREHWLSSYAHLESVRGAARGMSRRHPAISQLGVFFSDLQQHDSDYQAAEHWFLSFYPELIRHTQQWLQHHEAVKRLDGLRLS